MSAQLAQALRECLGKYDAEGFGCACAPGVVCGTCQWRERIRPMQAALAAHEAAPQQEPAITVTIDDLDLVQDWAESRLPPGTHKLYAAPQQAQAPGWQLVPEKITEEQHVAACKVLLRANGMDGLPQRMLDAIRAAAPQQGSNT